MELVKCRDPFFSLVVPTIERTYEVEALLASIRNSEFKDFEVIIVDQNQDNRLDQIIDIFRPDFDILHLKVEFRGLARARNYGARYAKGQWINFPDDDCELKRELLGNAKQNILDRNISVLTGSCVDRNGKFSGRFVNDETYVDLSNIWGRFIDAAIFIDRKVFLDLAGFDERFGVGSQYGGEEGGELLIRLIKHLPRESLYYNYKVQFYHPHKAYEFTTADCQRSYNYSRGSGANLAKWPYFHMYIHAANLILRGIVGAIIFRKGKRWFYLNRLKGFFHGYLEFRRCDNDRY